MGTRAVHFPSKKPTSDYKLSEIQASGSSWVNSVSSNRDLTRVGLVGSCCIAISLWSVSQYV